jgi:membrane dipeptidase
MRWIDGHLDLAYLAVNGRDVRREADDPQTGCVSLQALRASGIEIVLGTIFTEPAMPCEAHPHAYPHREALDAAEQAGQQQLRVYEQLEAEGALSIMRRAADLDGDLPLPKVAILMEGADPIRTPDDLQVWFERGVRIVGLTWAAGTRYAGGNANGGPLTRLGVELIAALDAQGVIHDASHLSDEAFDGLLDHARGPIIASHSNCRVLLEPKQRHLRDDQIKAIGERGGVVGLNLYSGFLAKDRRATVADCVAHVEHIAKVMGHRRGVALGSDMDGGFGPHRLPEGLDHPAKLTRLVEGLRAAGWSEIEIADFAYGNWRRFISAVLSG